MNKNEMNEIFEMVWNLSNELYNLPYKKVDTRVMYDKVMEIKAKMINMGCDINE